MVYIRWPLRPIDVCYSDQFRECDFNVINSFFSQQNRIPAVPSFNINKEDENEEEPPVSEESVGEKWMRALGYGIVGGAVAWFSFRK